MPKFLTGCHYNEEEINRDLKNLYIYIYIYAGPNWWQQVCNRSNPEKKPVEVVKGRILAGWAQKSPKPCFSSLLFSLIALVNLWREATAAHGCTLDTQPGPLSLLKYTLTLKAPPHMRLRACNHCHFKHSHWWKRRSRSKFAASHYAWGTDGGSMWVNAIRWMQSPHGFLHDIKWIMFHGHLGCYRKPPLGVGLPQNQETIALRTLTTVDYFILSCVRTYMNRNSLKYGWGRGYVWLHTTLEGPWPHYMILEVCWDALWTLSFGLPQLHGHGSWLVCEVALTHTCWN
jgi:hypothetical protein